MNSVAISFKSIAIIILYFGLTAILEANCDTPASGCPPYNQMSGSFPKGSNVQVQVSGGNATTNAAVAAAITSLNNDATANGTGITFTQVPSVNTSAPYVTITMDTTTTSPADGSKELIGSISPTGTGPVGSATFSNVDVTIYLAGVDSSGSPNFNSAQSGYQAAVGVAIQHELYHSIGVGDAVGGRTLMSPWVDTNDSMISGAPVVNGPTACDDSQSKEAQAARASGSMCSAGT